MLKKRDGCPRIARWFGGLDDWGRLDLLGELVVQRKARNTCINWITKANTILILRFWF